MKVLYIIGVRSYLDSVATHTTLATYIRSCIRTCIQVIYTFISMTESSINLQ